MKEQDTGLRALLRAQHELVLRSQAQRLGLTPRQIDARLERGDWARVHAGVYRVATSPETPEQMLLAACLAAGPWAVASHRSAAWLWGLTTQHHHPPDVSVPSARHPNLRGVIVHRTNDLDPLRTIDRRGIPCTDPLRAIVDLAAEAPRPTVTNAVDRALSSGLLTVAGLWAELDRRAACGRRGVAPLRCILTDRGLLEGPQPSVLEAETLRLFRRWNIVVLGREVHAGSDGQYRIDFTLLPPVAVEVDGFAYHWSPEAKSRDEARRNHLRLAGIFLLVYTWRDIRFEERRVGREISAALRAHSA